MTILLLPRIITLDVQSPWMYTLLLQTHPELHGIYEPPALVTLITTSLWIAAVRTGAFYESVSQETLTALTTQLFHRVFHQESMLVESPEYILGNSKERRRRKKGKTDG